MADGLVRLVWEVDSDGYEIVKEYRRPGRTASMFDADRGPSQCDEIVKNKEPPRSVVQDWIVPRGGKEQRIEARLLEHEIFLDLANSAKQPGPEGVRQFVNEWGLLRDPRGESLAEFVSLRSRFLSLMSWHHTDWDRGNLGELIIKHQIKRGQPTLFFQAQSLLQFCVLEFYQASSNKIDLRACGACGAFLPLHKEGRPKRYCNDACKTAAWRAKHRRAINRRRRESRARK